MSSKKKKRLGRGLDALLGGDISSPESASAKSSSTAQTSLPNTLPIEKLQRGEYQPRTNMDPASLEELAASIKSQGINGPTIRFQLSIWVVTINDVVGQNFQVFMVLPRGEPLKGADSNVGLSNSGENSSRNDPFAEYVVKPSLVPRLEPMN